MVPKARIPALLLESRAIGCMTMPFDLPQPTGLRPDEAWLLLAQAAAPTVLDVCPPEDVELCPRLIPGAQVADPKAEIGSGPVITVCSKGGKLSQGLAACYRAVGQDVTFIEGGMAAWLNAGLPTISRHALSASGLYTAPLEDLTQASLTRWIVTRFLPNGSQLMTVHGNVAEATADRFDAPLLPSPEAAVLHFDLALPEIVLMQEAIAPLIPGVVRLHGPAEAGQTAMLALLDAAYAGTRP